ncbi:alpha/beta hydrolase [Lapidilactobacillus wuchangensis]|uniref:alpha/beta hydrolase n=1 Tax=Lapidilactobacillus wuchangensis TaxID=2486001 RepID=UPI000F78CBF0|nr:alpha/beta fold hydrolase [Lapidilactobacillus wuchangensis]
MWLVGTIIVLILIIFFAIAAWKTYDIAIRTTPASKEKYRQRSRDENDATILQWYDQQSWQVWQQQSEDQLTLKGYFLAGKEPQQPVVIVAHGYHHTHQQMAKYAKMFQQLGYQVLLPDSRGQGTSGGFHIGFGWQDRRDYLGWIQQVQQHCGQEVPIVLFGVSMGAATVLATSGEQDLPAQVQAVIADCGFDQVYTQVRHRVLTKYHLIPEPTVWLASLLTKHFAHYRLQDGNITGQVAKSKTPTLFIHGTEDNYVPLKSERILYAACHAPKREYLVANAGHTQAYQQNTAEYFSQVKKFLSSYVKDSGK